MHKKRYLNFKTKLLKSAYTVAAFGLLLALPQEGNAQYGLYGFGQQTNGRLGNNVTSANINPSSTPIDDGTNGKYIHLALGSNYTLGIKEDGSLWAWGSNAQSQLGDPALSGNIATPQKIDDGTGAPGKWVRVYVSELQSSFGIREDGSLWAWGVNSSKQLGLPGTPANNVTTPTQVMPGSKWLMVDGGSDDGGFTIGIQQDSTLWGWGTNGSGYLLGTGNTTNQNTPYNITPGEKWLQISTGAYFTLAIKADGSLWGWGKGHTGVASTLGDNGSTNVSAPKQIDPGTGNKWKKVAAGSYHTVAIREDGSLWAWGQNGGGRLGDGTTALKNVITKIDDGTNGKWIDVAGSVNSSFGMKDNNKIYVWGEPDGLAVGGPPPYHSTTPKEITEAGTLNNGRIFIGRQHFFWINDLPITCNQTENHITSDITTGGATISWDIIAGAAGYEIAIDQTADLAPTGTAAPLIDTFHIASGLLSGETYYAHIRTDCGGGAYSAWDTISFTTLPCLSPLNIIAGQIATNGGIISWDPVSGAGGYEIVVDQTAAPAPSGTPVPLTDTFYNATVTPDDTWYVHIRTDCGGGNYSDWDTISFTTPPVCLQATGFKTEDITSATAKISWDAVTLATEYDVAIDKFATLPPGGSSFTQTATNYNATQLDPGQTYYVHLRSHCGNGNYSEWDTLSFITAGSGYVGAFQHHDAISVYPNPAGQTLYISSSTLLNAHIYNVQGQEVYAAGQVRKVDIDQLNAGIYILKLTNAEGITVKTTRFVKQNQ